MSNLGKVSSDIAEGIYLEICVNLNLHIFRQNRKKMILKLEKVGTDIFPTLNV